MPSRHSRRLTKPKTIQNLSSSSLLTNFRDDSCKKSPERFSIHSQHNNYFDSPETMEYRSNDMNQEPTSFESNTLVDREILLRSNSDLNAGNMYPQRTMTMNTFAPESDQSSTPLKSSRSSRLFRLSSGMPELFRLASEKSLAQRSQRRKSRHSTKECEDSCGPPKAHDTSIADEIKNRAYRDSMAAADEYSAVGLRSVHGETSRPFAPIRRKSLYTPGIATRSVSDILRKPNDRSEASTVPADHVNDSNVENEGQDPTARLPSVPLSNLDPYLRRPLSDTSRSATPIINVPNLGGLSIGTLRVTNAESRNVSNPSVLEDGPAELRANVPSILNASAHHSALQTDPGDGLVVGTKYDPFVPRDSDYNASIVHPDSDHGQSQAFLASTQSYMQEYGPRSALSVTCLQQHDSNPQFPSNINDEASTQRNLDHGLNSAETTPSFDPAIESLHRSIGQTQCNTTTSVSTHATIKPPEYLHPRIMLQRSPGHELRYEHHRNSVPVSVASSSASATGYASTLSAHRLENGLEQSCSSDSGYNSLGSAESSALDLRNGYAYGKGQQRSSLQDDCALEHTAPGAAAALTMPPIPSTSEISRSEKILHDGDTTLGFQKSGARYGNKGEAQHPLESGRQYQNIAELDTASSVNHYMPSTEPENDPAASQIRHSLSRPVLRRLRKSRRSLGSQFRSDASTPLSSKNLDPTATNSSAIILQVDRPDFESIPPVPLATINRHANRLKTFPPLQHTFPDVQQTSYQNDDDKEAADGMDLIPLDTMEPSSEQKEKRLSRSNEQEKLEYMSSVQSIDPSPSPALPYSRPGSVVSIKSGHSISRGEVIKDQGRISTATQRPSKRGSGFVSRIMSHSRTRSKSLHSPHDSQIGSTLSDNALASAVPCESRASTQSAEVFDDSDEDGFPTPRKNRHSTSPGRQGSQVRERSRSRSRRRSFRWSSSRSSLQDQVDDFDQDNDNKKGSNRGRLQQYEYDNEAITADISTVAASLGKSPYDIATTFQHGPARSDERMPNSHSHNYIDDNSSLDFRRLPPSSCQSECCSGLDAQSGSNPYLRPQARSRSRARSRPHTGSNQQQRHESLGRDVPLPPMPTISQADLAAHNANWTRMQRRISRRQASGHINPQDGSSPYELSDSNIYSPAGQVSSRPQARNQGRTPFRDAERGDQSEMINTTTLSRTKDDIDTESLGQNIAPAQSHDQIPSPSNTNDSLPSNSPSTDSSNHGSDDMWETSRHRWSERRRLLSQSLGQKPTGTRLMSPPGSSPVRLAREDSELPHSELERDSTPLAAVAPHDLDANSHKDNGDDDGSRDAPHVSDQDSIIDISKSRRRTFDAGTQTTEISRMLTSPPNERLETASTGQSRSEMTTSATQTDLPTQRPFTAAGSQDDALSGINSRDYPATDARGLHIDDDHVDETNEHGKHRSASSLPYLSRTPLVKTDSNLRLADRTMMGADMQASRAPTGLNRMDSVRRTWGYGVDLSDVPVLGASYTLDSLST